MKTMYIILALAILSPGIASAAEITIINDGLYFTTLHQELQQAKKSIYAELYLIKPSPNKKDTPTWILLNDLVQAQKRGIKVKVFIEGSHKYSSSQEAYSFLKENGVPVSYDDPKKIAHSKLVIIDRKKTFIGSSNWIVIASLPKACEAI